MKKKIIISIVIFILVMVLASAGMKIYSGYVVRTEIDKTIRETSSIVDIDYEQIRFQYFNPEFKIKALTVKLARPEAMMEQNRGDDIAREGILKIDEIRVYRYIVHKDFPTDIHLAANGIHLDTTRYPFRELNPYLEKMGYRKIKVDFSLEYVFYPKNKTLHLKRLHIQAKHSGSLEISARLNNINLPKIISNPNDKLFLLTLLPGISVAEVIFSYRDSSLAQRLYHLNAGRHGRSPRDLMLKAVQKLETDIAAEETVSIRRTMQAVVNFLRNPEKIKITIKPEKPVPLGRLIWVKTPRELIEVLGTEVES